MTKKTEKTETENKAPTPIAEVLIATGMQLGSEQGLKLGELVGHFEIAKIEVYKRITDSALAAASAFGPRTNEFHSSLGLTLGILLPSVGTDR